LGRRVVADLEDPVAHEPGDLDVAVRRDLTGDVHLAGGHHRLDRDPAARVLPQQRVEDAVADRVAHLVGMALGHRLAREQPSSPAPRPPAPPPWPCPPAPPRPTSPAVARRTSTSARTPTRPPASWPFARRAPRSSSAPSATTSSGSTSCTAGRRRTTSRRT